MRKSIIYCFSLLQIILILTQTDSLSRNISLNFCIEKTKQELPLCSSVCITFLYSVFLMFVLCIKSLMFPYVYKETAKICKKKP